MNLKKKNKKVWKRWRLKITMMIWKMMKIHNNKIKVKKSNLRKVHKKKLTQKTILSNKRKKAEKHL